LEKIHRSEASSDDGQTETERENSIKVTLNACTHCQCSNTSFTMSFLYYIWLFAVIFHHHKGQKEALKPAAADDDDDVVAVIGKMQN
jgi:hypothetical protein